MACLDIVCVANDIGCEDAVTAFECDDTGTARTLTECPEEHVCVDGVCRDLVCVRGASVCDGAGVRTCASDGLSWDSAEPCPTGESCIPEIQACAASTCSPGDTECFGDAFATCDASGTSRTVIDCAAQDEICGTSDGVSRCLPRVCEPDTVACDGNVVEECDARGATLTRSPCAEGFICVSGGCVASTGECPTASFEIAQGDEVLPQTVLELSAASSLAALGELTRWEWTVEQPSGSTSRVSPDAARSEVTFEANVIGTYLFRLRVWDAAGVESCVVAERQVVVTTDEAIHIELTWTTPGDGDDADTGPGAGSDLDLHFLHPSASNQYFDAPWDCFWRNPEPSWGASGVLDDPRLARSDMDGAGPEIVELSLPEFAATYRVGVHYLEDSSFGSSSARLRVYVYGSLRQEWADVELEESDLWDAFTIEWPSQAVTRVGSGTTPAISPDVDLPPGP